ncbi:MAG: RES family NAD+ phosphorylase [Nitrososphaerales archaeon]
MTRGRQGGPPRDLSKFPVRRQERRLWRAARREPWWYCSDGDCRFDLDAPKGTCYLGTDELVGILESIGPELSNGVVAITFLEQRKLFSWTPRNPLRTADLVSRRAAGFGATNELSTMRPYAVPRSWARAFEGAGFAGVTYRSRFDPGATPRAVAHFGPAGLAKRSSGTGRAIGPDLCTRLESECGIAVARPPRLRDLTRAR